MHDEKPLPADPLRCIDVLFEPRDPVFDADEPVFGRGEPPLRRRSRRRPGSAAGAAPFLDERVIE